MIELKDVTIVCIDCYNYGSAAIAIKRTLEKVTPDEMLFLTDINIEVEGAKTVIIPSIKSKEDYSKFCIKDLTKYVNTKFALVIQWDGYVIDETAWDKRFLDYDYIGAPWRYTDGRNVGNGGFSLRSKKLLDILYKDPEIFPLHPEDDAIARTYRPYLEAKYGIEFCPEDIAESFSYELREPNKPTFGFHGNFYHKYMPTVIIKRTGAVGDVILTEPVMRYYAFKGYNVILDTSIEIYSLFKDHYFPIKHISEFDSGRITPEKVINLDMSYEAKPKQNRLKSYFEFSGVSDYKLSRPTLFPLVDEKTKLFKKYVLLHIDQKLDMPYRNIYGVNWKQIKRHLEAYGYTVLQIGKETHDEVTTEINTPSLAFLKFLIAGCDMFIGIDSGPLNMAMAYMKPCIGFFGSVNPEYVYPDTTGMEVIQQPCIYQNCYHSLSGTVTGVKCVLDEKKPPCCIAETEQVIEAIDKIEKQKSDGSRITQN